MKKILVLGAYGQLGTCLQECAFDRKSGFGQPVWVFKDRVDFDVTTPEGALQSRLYEINPALIINCAAYTNVNKCEDVDTQEVCYVLNSDYPARLAHYCKDNHIKLIHISSDYVFSGDVEPGMEYIENTTTSLIDPKNEYGRSKLMGEYNVLRYNPQGFIIRISNLVSVHSINFVKTIVKKILAGEPELFVTPDHIAYLTSAHDFALELVKLSNKYLIGSDDSLHPTKTDILHYTSTPSGSFYDFAIMIRDSLERFGVPVRTEIVPKCIETPVERPKVSMLNSKYTQQRWGMKVKPIENTIEKIIVSLINTRNK